MAGSVSVTTGQTAAPAVQERSFWQGLGQFRFLMVVYGLALAAAAWEFSRRGEKVDLYLDPEANFANTLYELYPRRGEAKYEKALQATLCLAAQSREQPLSAACRQYESIDLGGHIRRQFEQALETRIKTKEGLYYHYVEILVGSRASPARIDAAYEAWRRNFPLSKLPDPRTLTAGPGPDLTP